MATKKLNPQDAKPMQFLCVGGDGYSGDVADSPQGAFASYCEQSGNADDEDVAERCTFYRVEAVDVNIVPAGVCIELM